MDGNSTNIICKAQQHVWSVVNMPWKYSKRLLVSKQPVNAVIWIP